MVNVHISIAQCVYVLYMYMFSDVYVYLFPPQAASLPMSIIIVGVGPAEFDGKCVYLSVCLSV